MTSPSKGPTWWGRIRSYLVRWTAPEVVIALGILLVTALQLWVLKRQTNILDLQRKDAIEAGRQTALIAAAQTYIAQYTEDSANTARASLSEATEVGRADKRAYITLARFSGPQRLEAGEEIKTDLIWKNSGNTAARRVEPDCHFWTQPPGPPQEPSHTKPKGLGNPTELGPSQRLQSFPTYRVNSRDWPDVASGKRLVFISATVDYEDIFRERWRAHVVAQYERDGWTSVDMGTKRQPHAEE